jgi:hypothetical protein
VVYENPIEKMPQLPSVHRYSSGVLSTASSIKLKVAGGMENRPKIKCAKSTNGLWDRLGQLESVPKLVSEWSGDGRKVEKI